MRMKMLMSSSKSRFAACLAAMAISFGLAACGGDDGEDNPAIENDAGDSDAGDAGHDGGSDGDAGPDADTDTDGGSGDPDDRDGDGVPNEEDNCPDAANAEQADRDRDGVGDACDHMPSIHDPDNPDAIGELLHKEDDVGLDDFPVTSEEPSLELPFVVDGNVADPSGGEDVDYYTFKINRPSLLLLDIEPQGNEDLWPAAQINGYELPTANARRFLLGPEPSQQYAREVFLPVAGKYTLIVSDQYNWLQGSNAGGDEHDYRVSLAAVPFGEAESISLPMAPDESPAETALKVYEVDVKEIDALEIDSLGDPSEQNAVNLPLVNVYDPEAERTLAYNTAAQVSDNAEVELTTKVGSSGRVWVIQDAWQRRGESRNVLEVSETAFDSELETFNSPQDERFDDLVWFQPGVSITGVIGPPRAVSDTELEADTDYHLMTVAPGELLTVDIIPGEESRVELDVDVGFYYENTTSSGDYESIFVQFDSESADAPGEPVSISTIVDSSRAGEVAVRVRHAPNIGSQAPEGGTDFDYEISMQAGEPEFDELADLPEVIDAQFEEVGEFDYYSFQAEAGDRFNILNLHPFPQLGIFDGDTFELLASASFSNRLTWRAEDTGEYVVAARTYYNSAGAEYTLGLEKISATEIPSVPATESGAIELAPFSDWYKMDVSDGEAFRVSVDPGGSQLDPDIYVYNGETMELMDDNSGSVRWLSTFDGEVYIGVADNDDGGPADENDPADYSFTMDVDRLDSEEISPDTPKTGQLENGDDIIFYGFDAPAGAVDVRVEANGTWTPDVELVDANSLDEVTTNDIDYYRGSAFYAESVEGSYAIAVSASDDSLVGPLDFEVEVTFHEPGSAIPEEEPNDTIGDAQHLEGFPLAVHGSLAGGVDEEDFYTFDLIAGQRLWLITTRHGDVTNINPRMYLYRPDGSQADYDSSSSEGLYPAFYALEADQSGTWELEHYFPYSNDRAGDYILYAATSGSNDFDESEPNDAQGEAQQLGEVDLPTRIRAEVDGSDPVDAFSFETVRDLDTLEIFLEDASDGFELRLLDDAYNEIASSGPSHDGNAQPYIDAGQLAPGDYYLELVDGDAAGTADVIMIPDP